MGWCKEIYFETRVVVLLDAF